MSMREYVPGTKAWRSRRHRELCAEALDRIDEIVDRELPPDRRARDLERHIDDCVTCGTEAESIARLKTAIARAAEGADPATVERLQELARRLCTGEQGGPGE